MDQVAHKGSYYIICNRCAASLDIRTPRRRSSPAQRAAITNQALKTIGGHEIQSLSTLRLWIGLRKAPEVALQVSQIREWIEIWLVVRGEDRRRTIAAWRLAQRELKKTSDKDRWKKVSGPMSAACAILLDIGWLAPLPHRWLDHSRLQAANIDLDKSASSQVPEAIEQSIVDLQWQGASQHYLGEGLQHGEPDLEAYRRARRLMLKQEVGPLSSGLG